jgi:MscS family membrane protein
MEQFLSQLESLSWGRALLAFGALVLILLIKRIVDRVVLQRLHELAERTSMRYDDLLIGAVRPPLNGIFFAIGIYLALMLLQLPEEPWDLPALLGEAWSVTLLVLGVWLVLRLVDPLTAVIQDGLAKSDEVTSQQFTPIIRSSLRFVIFALAGVLLIQNLGYQVSSLIAGLGIGGLAVALAAQDTLANVFGTVVMLTDRPFQVGDWVLMAGVEGTVEEIGFRSTRIRTWGKSLVVVPNKLLTSQTIENWSAMPVRRVKQTLSLTYGTSREKMETFVQRVRALLAEDAAVDQRFHMVNFTDFGASSLDILVYYFTRTTAWAEYMNERQRINLEMMRIAEEVGVSFAFPTQTLHFGEPLRVLTEDRPPR